MKRTTYFALIALLVILAGCQSVPEQTIQDTVQQQSQDAAVATVNGEPITQSDLATQQAFLAQQGVQASEQQIVQQLIARTLLLQEAEKRDIEIGDGAVIERVSESLAAQGLSLNELQEQSPEAYAQLLAQQRQQLVFLELAGNISASDEEARAVYDANAEQIVDANGSQLAYGEVAGQLKAQIEEQKFNQNLNALVAQLEQDADIVVN